MADTARLIEDFFGVFECVGGVGLGLDHLRVAGDRGERIFEFMRNTSGEFAEGGEVFSKLHLLLERSEFGQVAKQTDCAGGFFLCAANGGDGDTEFAMNTVGSDVFCLFAPKGFAVRKTLLDKIGQLA